MENDEFNVFMYVYVGLETFLVVLRYYFWFGA